MAPLVIKIAALRQAKGWTQAELADRAGVARVTVNRLENGKPNSIDLAVLEKLASALGVAPGLLIVTEAAAKKGKGR